MKKRITKSVKNHELNSHLSLKCGWVTLDIDPKCSGNPPAIPTGVYGEYMCVNGEWTFFQAV